MATNTSDFFTFSKTAGTAKNLQKPTDGGDNNLWGGFINVDLDTIVGAVNATSDLIADANQNELVDFTATGSAVNHVGITNAATGNGPTIEAKGDDTNIDLNVSGKGTGALASTGAKLTSPKVITGVNDTNGNELVKVTPTGSAVNEITVKNAATGNGPTISATGDDTNIDLNIAGKGSGTAKFTSNIIIPDAGNVGSVSDPDAIAISSGGNVTLSQTLDGGAIGPAVTMSANQACVKTAVNASGSAPIFAIRAWANFNGSTYSTVGSGNVSSVTDPEGGPGRYRVNFTTDMGVTNYSVVVSDNHSSDSFTTGAARGFNMIRTRASNYVECQTFEDGGAQVDVSGIFVIVTH